MAHPFQKKKGGWRRKQNQELALSSMGYLYKRKKGQRMLGVEIVSLKYPVTIGNQQHISTQMNQKMTKIIRM